MSQPAEGASADLGAPAQVASWLQNFLILMAVISAIACAFVWQANAIADVQARTFSLRQQAVSIEQENARLMVQLATLDSPANVEREAARLGLVYTRPPEIRVYAALAPVPADNHQPASQVPDPLASLANDVARLTGLRFASTTDATP
jgi:cell division protein FtsB